MFISRDCVSALAISGGTYLACSFGESALESCQRYLYYILYNVSRPMLEEYMYAGYMPMMIFAKFNPAMLAP